MALKYPISVEELIHIHGVGEGKAKKYGKEFVELIVLCRNEFCVGRFVVKSTGINQPANCI
jgi:ATP-dependent DNA helicase RecQ